MDRVFESLVYENASGVKTILSDRMISSYWELRGRSGFSAPEVELISQKYVNGREKIVGRIIKPRLVSINMVVTGKSSAQRDSIFFEMIDHLIDIRGGDVGKLHIKRTDGQTVYLNCAYSSGLNVTEEYRKFHRFTLEFYAADPYFYNDSARVYSLEDTNSDMVTLANDLYLGAWYLGIGNVSGYGTVTNIFDYVVEPVITVKGRHQNITITSGSTGDQIAFANLPMVRGDDLIIDTREQSKDAYILHSDGTTVSAMPYLDWSTMNMSLPLAPGANSITWTGYGEIQPLIFEYTQQFLSA